MIKNLNIELRGVCNGIESVKNGTTYVENVSIFFAKSYGINVRANHSRTAVLHTVAVWGANDSDYKYMPTGIICHGTDNEFNNIHMAFCHYGFRLSGNTRISNSHIFCGKGTEGIYNASIGIFCEDYAYLTLSDIYIDTFMYAISTYQNSKIEVSNLILWNGENDESQGGRIFLPTGDNNFCCINGAIIYLGNKKNYSLLMYNDDTSSNVFLIDDATITFPDNDDVSSGDENIVPFTYHGYKRKNYNCLANTAGKYIEIAKIRVNTFCEISICTQNFLKNKVFLKKDSAITVKKENDTFDLKYKVSGEIVTLYIAGDFNYGVISIKELASTIYSGVMLYDYITKRTKKYTREEIEDSSGLLNVDKNE